jgi:hypothetical protein
MNNDQPGQQQQSGQRELQHQFCVKKYHQKIIIQEITAAKPWGDHFVILSTDQGITMSKKNNPMMPLLFDDRFLLFFASEESAEWFIDHFLKTTDPGELAIAEYNGLRTEERDRINARLQIWGIFVSLVSIFGVVSLQSDLIAYIVALFPPLCLCLAYHVRHSEDVLYLMRKYLYAFEKHYKYRGYEHFGREQIRATHGGYLTALGKQKELNIR